MASAGPISGRHRSRDDSRPLRLRR